MVDFRAGCAGVTMKKFEPFADGVLPWLTCLAMLAPLAMVFLYVPTERVQGVVLRVLAGDNDLVAGYAAVLGIVGVLDIPILYVAVRLRRGLHPKVERMAPEMAWTLLVCTGAFLCVFTWLFLLRLRSLSLCDEV